jgi:hypothetical protein
VLVRSIVFALEHFSDYNLFQNLSLDELLPWVGVQGSFEQFGPPKLVLSWHLAALKYSVICYIFVKVVDSGQLPRFSCSIVDTEL